MSPWNSIRVKHRNQNKNKILSQKMSSHISFVQKKFNYSSHGITWRSLYGMYSGWNKYYGFISSKFNNFLVAKGKTFSCFKPFFPLMWRYNNKIKNSSLICFIEKILAKEDVFVVFVLLIESTDIFSTFLIAIGICESKLNTTNQFIEHIVEFKN